MNDGAGHMWSFINPINFHFYCIFGPFFTFWCFIRLTVFRKFFKKFRSSQKSTNICSKTLFWSNFGLILDLKKAIFRVKPPVVFQNFGAFDAEIGSILQPSAADVWNPPWAESPPIPLIKIQRECLMHEYRL